MPPATEVDCVRYPEEMEAAHGNYRGHCRGEEREDWRNNVYKMLTRSTLTASSQTMVATLFIIGIILIFIKMQKIVFEGERWEVNCNTIS